MTKYQKCKLQKFMIYHSHMGKSYTGQPECAIEVRLKEHEKNVDYRMMEKSTVIKHVKQVENNIDFLVK